MKKLGKLLICSVIIILAVLAFVFFAKPAFENESLEIAAKPGINKEEVVKNPAASTDLTNDVANDDLAKDDAKEDKKGLGIIAAIEKLFTKKETKAEVDEVVEPKVDEVVEPESGEITPVEEVKTEETSITRMIEKVGLNKSSSRAYLVMGMDHSTCAGCFILALNSGDKNYSLVGVDEDLPRTETELAELLGIKFSGRISFYFDAIAPTVDTLGGINIGGVDLSGDEAYSYWQDGSYVGDGANQMTRQKKLLKSFVSSAMAAIKGDLPIALTLYKTASNYISSNLSLASILKLALNLVSYKDLGMAMISEY